MANGMILRGEVYWVSVDDSIGGEIQTGRPAVIVSGDRANEKCSTVIAAFITSQGNFHPHNVTVMINGVSNRVKCDQLRTISKDRLTRYMDTLTKPEMVRITGALATAMCIPLKTPESTPQEKENKEITALRAECEMWKRCYDVVMTQLVDLKVNTDLTLRMARAGYGYEESEEIEIEEPPVFEEPVVEESEPPKEPEEPEQEESELVEINTCSAEDLKRCGCNPVMIESIINARPYMRLDELRVVNGITSVAYGLLKHKLCCVPVKVEPEVVVEQESPVEEPEAPVEESVASVASVVEPAAEIVLSTTMTPLDKVNINTATAREISEHLGIGRLYPSRIVTHRNKNGKFVAVEELKMVEGLPRGFYEQYGDRCTIGEPEVMGQQPVEEPTEEPEEKPGKVNVNTASAEEIVTRTRMSFQTAKNIVAYRKKNGPFRDVASLVLVDRFGAGCLKSYGDMLTVGEPEEPSEEEPESDKVNINTANMYELMAVGFEKRAAALIVNERRKFGRFRSVDDLAEIPEITGKILRKLRDKLEV